MVRPAVIKTSGYLISSVSVMLLGVVSWKSASEQPVLLARSSRILCRHLIRAQGANWIGGAPVTSIERQPLRGAGTCTDAAFMSESSVR